MTDNYEVVLKISSQCEKELEKSGKSLDEYYERIIDVATKCCDQKDYSQIKKLAPSFQEKLYFETTVYILKLSNKERRKKQWKAE